MPSPTWIEFSDRPVPEFDPPAPAAELASVLQRYRADLDAAARAGAEGRVQGLRALAEQAVLAIELEKRLDHQSTLEPLRALKDRMLARIELTELEIVRLVGSPLATVADLVEIDSWRFDDRYPAAVVAEELEVAVCHQGRLLRRGRVVVGAPRDGGPGTDTPEPRRVPAEPAVADVRLTPSGDGIVCPVRDCGAVNDVAAEVCVVCLTELGGYRRLSLFPQVLFNRGLSAARTGDSHAARDCFAAAVLWSPDDLETRNAYALACLESHDVAAARRAWEEVLARAPDDERARRGMRALPRGLRR